MNKLRKYYRFITRDVWRTTTQGFSRTTRIGLVTLKTLIMSVKGFNQNDLNTRANSLTYSMTFAIVPILALIVAIARGFGFESVIEHALQSSFLASYNIVPTIMGFVNRYLETAQGGVFLGVGMLILLWAVYSFFRNVENSFNKIWQVEKSRSIMRQFTNYITILLMVPILIVLSSGASIFLSTHNAHSMLHVSILHDWLIRIIPWASTCLIMFLMYLIVPNTKVKVASALIPGILIGSLVCVLESLSVYIIMFLSRTSIVYGTFAAIPLLMTWVQWTCLLILTGAELSYSIQNNEQMDFAKDTEAMSRRYKDYLTLYICYRIIKRFEAGEEPLSAQELAHSCNLPARNVNQLISRLVEVRILNQVGGGSEIDEVRYQPCLDIHRITVGLVLSQIDQQGGEGFFPGLPKEMDAFWQRWLQLKDAERDFHHVLVKDLLKEEAHYIPF